MSIMAKKGGRNKFISAPKRLWQWTGRKMRGIGNWVKKWLTTVLDTPKRMAHWTKELFVRKEKTAWSLKKNLQTKNSQWKKIVEKNAANIASNFQDNSGFLKKQLPDVAWDGSYWKKNKEGEVKIPEVQIG